MLTITINTNTSTRQQPRIEPRHALRITDAKGGKSMVGKGKEWMTPSLDDVLVGACPDGFSQPARLRCYQSKTMRGNK